MAIKAIYETLTVPLSFVKKQRNRKHIHLRRAGDMARDNKNWLEAIQFYERYLALVPTAGSIWIQLGHVRKENGRLSDAETAYLTAQALMPRNADLLLQLGHIFKLQGRRNDAVKSYAASLKLAPGAAAYGELIELDEIVLANDTISASEIRLPPAVYLQISDLLSYLEHHQTVSGIQRVQLGILEYVIDSQNKTNLTNYKFVYSGSRGQRLFLVDTQILKAITSCLSNVRVDHGYLRGLVMRARSSTTSIALGKGDTFVVLGSYWGHGGSTELLRSLKVAGVKTGIYFYDIIPFTHPEFCDDRLTAEFTQALIECVHFIDFGLTISNFTRNELERFIQKNGIATIPFYTVPLAHSIKAGGVTSDTENEEWPETIVEFRGKRFVICVSTLEVRKNHHFLFEVWKALISDGVDVPFLLFIGRQGWRIDDLMGQLEATAYLDGRIAILHDISDSELNCLYRHCLFTTFPSFIEGWGLPIGESLSFGKLCIASNTSSMPEVGENFVEYVDPLNARAAIDTFRKFIDSQSEITAWETRIHTTFQQRDWSAVSRHFLDTLACITAELRHVPGDLFVPTLASGVVFEAGRDCRTSKKKRLGFEQRQRNLVFHGGWTSPTEHGVQMAGSEGNIIFKPDGDDNCFMVLLRLRIDGNRARYKVCAEPGNSMPIQFFVQGARESAIRLPVHPDEDGCIRIRLRVDKSEISKSENAELSTTILQSLGYAAADDTSQWMHLLEGAFQVDNGIPVTNVT